ncbi:MULTISPECIES: hypothetical protein [unclassified Neisseria]|uniref:hypothetical protein n=1 Tax=unclassified Neisseria TaxID=2623750 RepID=UPI00266571DC|nr:MULTISPECIES: hypothetical protein [unclassified Neisseria]MDO1510393.1 hypothetical protein [Neisseria sp. MVDL19-042950]MDO1516562.1 hypothetical protein [Neisseria sp. MVDL18-041461]MDO1563645.1 hypothetical protein [Neisseria sp. MVDL20-010259]
MAYQMTVDNIHLFTTNPLSDFSRIADAIGKESACKLFNAFQEQGDIIKPINFDMPYAKNYAYHAMFENQYNKIKDVIGEEATNKLAQAEFVQYTRTIRIIDHPAQGQKMLADWYEENGIEPVVSEDHFSTPRATRFQPHSW